MPFEENQFQAAIVFFVFPNQDHVAHIEAHRAFMSSYLVRNNPQVMTVLQAHIVEHISAMARNEVMIELQPVLQQEAAKFGGQVPEELQAQFQAEIEKQVAIRIAAMIDDMVAEEQEAINFGEEQNPLVDIKMKELDLEQQKINVDAADDLAQHQLEEEKLSYKIPYFYFYGTLCFLHPEEDGVDLGFTKGYELSDDQKILEAHGRKHVKSITFYSLAQLEEYEDPIRRLLNEAAILNEYQHKRKLKNKK